MAATDTVHQFTVPPDSTATSVLAPRHGVITLFGYGTKVHVTRGHLLLNDGIAGDRREVRLPRVGHGLRRLVIIGSDGMVSFAALRWLADQDVAFVMVDRDGSVLVATGPVGPSDARLRRAQALAHHCGIAMPIVRELIDRKLAGQERIAREMLCDPTAVQTIASARAELGLADMPTAVRQLEAQAALAYWSAWRSVPIQFPRGDMARVPEHWRTFGARRSPISNSPRVAVNPPNAILNYLYAVLESEARLAAVALGLDPGLGVLHVDTDARDSLALDLLEPVRPLVDAYVLDWLTREPLRGEWFFEQRDGNYRLMAPFAVRLAETARTWGRAIAPVGEWFASMLWSTIRKSARHPRLPTRLTERHRREAKGETSTPTITAPRPPRVCRGCGTPLQRADHTYCVSCRNIVAREALIEAAAKGRRLSHTPEAEARRATALRRNRAAQCAWNPADQPRWLTEHIYSERIQPGLAPVKISTLAAALGVSKPYAVSIRAGRCRPHPRHWAALARLVGISSDQ
jgi:CRISPR-associated endonuclease Cas1